MVFGELYCPFIGAGAHFGIDNAKCLEVIKKLETQSLVTIIYVTSFFNIAY